MGSQPRSTLQLQAVLRVLLDDPTGDHYGFEIARAAGLATGTTYPILIRLEDEGWLESEWEEIDESREGRRRRRYYRLTGEGFRAARIELAKAAQMITPKKGGLRVPGVGGAGA